MKTATTSAKTLAALFAVTEKEVAGLTADGIIPKPKSGQYPTARSIRQYIAHLKSGLPPTALARPKKPLIAESVREAARLLACDQSAIRKAAEAGAPGFLPHGRINVYEVSRWIQANPLKLLRSFTRKDELEIERLRQQCRRLVFDNDANEGQYILKSDVTKFMAETSMTIKSILTSALRNELPPKLVGLRAPQIADQMNRLIPRICDKLQFCHEPMRRRR